MLDNILGKFGYTKNPDLAHVPSGLEITAAKKSEDFMRHYTGWVYAIVKRRAEQMANVELKLMRQVGAEAEEVVDHPAVDLLDKANNYLTGRELKELAYMHLDLAGEVFWAVDRGPSKNGEPKSIVPLLPNRMKVIPGTDKFIKGYLYNRNSADNIPEEVSLEPQEVVFSKEPNPINLFRGMSAIQAAALTIDNDDAQEQWSFNFFRHGASAEPVFSTDQHLTPEALERLYTKMQKKWAGVENARKPMILHSGLKSAGNTAAMQKDMEFLQGQKWTRDKMMAMIGTTKTILGITEDVNRSNAETNEFVFAKYMVQPRVQKFIESLNEFYLPMFKGTQNMFFMMEDPVPVDADQQATIHEKALAGGSWMTPNEVRAARGLSPVENGDSLLMPSGLLAVDGTAQVNENVQRQTSRQRRVYRKEMTRVKREAQLKKHLENKFEGVAQKLLSSETVKLTYRQRAERPGGWHDQIKAFEETFTMKVKSAIQKYFEEHQEVALNQLRRNFLLVKTWEQKEPFDSLLPEKGVIKQVGIELMIPLLAEIMEERGNEALFFIGSRIGFDTSDPAAEKFIQNRAAELITGIDETTRDSLRKQLKEGINLGEGIPDLSDRVRSVYDTATDARAEMIARTETIKATNVATQQAWEKSGVVTGKEWITAKDERVDPLCAHMDGTIIPLKGNFFEKGDTLEAGGHTIKFPENTPVPPAHPNCRCTLIPVTGSVKSIKREAITTKDLDKLNKRFENIQEMYDI